jgi:hypothetical protein
MHQDVEIAIEQIDAAVFSSDCESKENVAMLKEKCHRWLRGLENLDRMYEDMEAEEMLHTGPHEGCAEFEHCGDDEPWDGFNSDAEADADALASAGWGTDEDYGYYGDDGEHGY